MEGWGEKAYNCNRITIKIKKNRWGEIKNGIGNRGLKELIWTTHGHELRGGGNAGGLGGRAEGG